jgi:4-hydroxyphenylpyruvate dioxygenase
LATVATYGDVEHTFVERRNYKGQFLPGYVAVKADPIASLLPVTGLLKVDHIVGNQPDNEMVPACDLYFFPFDD